MVGTYKPTGRAVSTPTGLAMGAGFSLVWTVLGAMLVAKLVDGETMGENAIGYGVAVILLTASFGGAMLSFNRIKRQRMAVCLGSGAIYFALLLAMTALLFGGQYSGVGVTAVLILGGSGAAALLGIRSGGGKRRRAYKVPRG